MTTKQREIHLRKVATAEVQGVLNCNEDACCRVPKNFDYSPLPVSPQEAKLSGIPLSTVEGIWKKAKDLLEKEGAVVNGPCLLLLLANLAVSHTLLPASPMVSYHVKVIVKTGLHYAYVAMLWRQHTSVLNWVYS